MPPAWVRQCISPLRDGRRLLKVLLLLVPVLVVGFYCWGLLLPKTEVDEEALQEKAGVPEAELLALSKSLMVLEEKRREQELLEKEVTRLHSEIGQQHEAILRAVEDVLEERDVDEEKREVLLQLTRAALEKIGARYVPMVDWALKSTGATIDTRRTSQTYDGRDGGSCWLCRVLFTLANPPDTILQPSTSPGQCWAFQGAVGHVVIRLPENIWPVAVTVEHIPKSVSPTGEVSSAPKDFAVFGMDEEGPEEDLLGHFVYDVEQEAVQTFHVKKQLPRAFRFIKIQVQSNWGKREYTCLYRVQVHGIMAARMQQLSHE